MGHEEVLSPVDDYRTRFRAAFANDLVAVFEGLFRQSGVDVGANRASVRAVQGLEAAIARLEAGSKSSIFPSNSTRASVRLPISAFERTYSSISALPFITKSGAPMT